MFTLYLHWLDCRIRFKFRLGISVYYRCQIACDNHHQRVLGWTSPGWRSSRLNHGPMHQRPAAAQDTLSIDWFKKKKLLRKKMLQATGALVHAVEWKYMNASFALALDHSWTHQNAISIRVDMDSSYINSYRMCMSTFMCIYNILYIYIYTHLSH